MNAPVSPAILLDIVRRAKELALLEKLLEKAGKKDD